MRLLRRREIWLPTFAGWLALLAIAASAGVVAVRGAHRFLAPNAPAGGGLLVVEGWGGAPVFAEAARRFATGRYAHVVTTGGPIERDSPIAADHTWAEHAAAALLRLDLPRDAVTPVPSPASRQDRTFRSAVTVREWIARRGERFEAIEIVTLGPHARRSRLLYERAFGPGTAIGVVAAAPDEYDAALWWASSEGAKSVLSEGIGWAFALCCFDAGAPGSHEEAWGAPTP
jgi:hypothetical protein